MWNLIALELGLGKLSIEGKIKFGEIFSQETQIIGCIKKGKVGFFSFDLWVDPARRNNFCKVWIKWTILISIKLIIFHQKNCKELQNAWSLHETVDHYNLQYIHVMDSLYQLNPNMRLQTILLSIIWAGSFQMVNNSMIFSCLYLWWSVLVKYLCQKSQFVENQTRDSGGQDSMPGLVCRYFSQPIYIGYCEQPLELMGELQSCQGRSLGWSWRVKII